MSNDTLHHRGPDKGFFYWATWAYIGIVFFIVAIALLFPDVAAAADGDSKRFHIAEGLDKEFDEGGKSFWNTIAVPMMWLSLLAAGVLLVFKKYEYVMYAAFTWVFFAFGDEIATFVMGWGK